MATSSALEEILLREPDTAKRLQAMRDWYVMQGQRKQWVVLETEFTLRAIRNRAVRTRLAKLRRQELETYSALVALHFSQLDRPATIALSLMAVVQGLGRLSLIDAGHGARGRFAEARNLVFNRLIAAREGATARIEETQE